MESPGDPSRQWLGESAEIKTFENEAGAKRGAKFGSPPPPLQTKGPRLRAFLE
jgi:hypothetical protein